MKRAAIYCRVSTQAQEDEGTSLGTQDERCRAYAAEHDYVVDEGHVYHEVFTGTELWDRPQLTRLRDAVRRRQVDVVVAYAIDRLARDPVHLGVILSEADHQRVAVEFVTEILDDSPEGQLIRFVRGYAAKVEHEKIRERSIRGKRARVESGKLLAGIPDLYGYRVDRERGVRVVHEPEARVVRRIYRWYTEDGLSINEVRRRLTAEGVPAPMTNRRAFPAGQVPRWNVTAVRHILRHEAYIGESWGWKYYREPGSTQPRLRPREEWIALPEGTTPPLVSRAEWDIAQHRLATNLGERARNQARPCLLRGLIFCAVCGRRLRVDYYHHRLYYRCPARDLTGARCGAVIVQAAPVEAWAWAEVLRRFDDPGLIARERAERQGRATEGLDEELANLRRRVRQLVQGQERVLARYSESDVVPWEIVEREIQRAETEKTELRARIAQLEQRRTDHLAARRQLQTLYDWMDRARANLDTMTFDERRKTLEVLGVRVLASGFDYAIHLDPQVF